MHVNIYLDNKFKDAKVRLVVGEMFQKKKDNEHKTEFLEEFKIVILIK